MTKAGIWFEKIFKFLASIKLALLILSSLAILSAIGTIYEARYDATYAQKIIYHSPYMYIIMGLLCVNLLNVMIDRLPWKAHHTGFILAHIGIIILIIGSLVTKIFGIDGSLAIDIGQKNRFVVMPDTEFVVFATFGEGSYKHLYTSQQDFLLNPPSRNPLQLSLDGQLLKVTDYYHYASRNQKVIESKSAYSGPAVRIQLQNPNVNVTQWILRAEAAPYEVMEMGPARIVLADKKSKVPYEGGNVIVLRPFNEDQMTYEIYTKSKGGLTRTGRLALAEAIETGWMGLKLRLLKYLPKAEMKTEFIKRDRPSGTTVSAVKIEFNGEEHWLGLNSNLQLFNDMTMYLVTYRNRMLNLGFDVNLDKFTVGRYQGTNRAMSYESEVTVPELGRRRISMNEPLKHNGYTFYQASFQENQQGEATTSILSVNKDPGRPFKYFGSFLIVLGTIVMFYFKRYRLKIFNKVTGKEASL